MAMRGDDLIGLKLTKTSERIHFLKGEVKSAAKLTSATVTKAREALKHSQSRPSPHALASIADRLHEEGEDELADEIDDALLDRGISLSQITHLIFTLSGNDPSKLLANNVSAYTGKLPQMAVGLRIPNHQEFIKEVYEKVIADANGK